jgi:hypothetical protein
MHDAGADGARHTGVAVLSALLAGGGGSAAQGDAAGTHCRIANEDWTMDDTDTSLTGCWFCSPEGDIGEVRDQLDARRYVVRVCVDGRPGAYSRRIVFRDEMGEWWFFTCQEYAEMWRPERGETYVAKGAYSHNQ